MQVSSKNLVHLVLGTQWGDEGKGKIIDLLGENADVVARFQGGANAGHTVKIKGKQYILHLIPSGILRPQIRCYIGNGLVIDPEAMLKEIEDLEAHGIDVLDRLYISQNAHLILPYHKIIDKTAEKIKEGKKIGTTGRGIGPAYADKANRIGIRVGELLNENQWKTLVAKNIGLKNHLIRSVYDTSGVEADEVIELLSRFRDKLSHTIVDVMARIHEEIKNENRILLEGAQGSLLDIDFGTYPYVTSSNTTIGGVFTGLGIPPRTVDQVIGILKSYTTRVGNGPLPTELTEPLGDHIREMGKEYGATTGRPRRCGWLDTVVAKYSIEINGIDELVITKLDVLDTLDSVKICTGYQVRNQITDRFSSVLYHLDDVEPVYEELDGWKQKISDIRKYKDLPEATRKYLQRIEEILKIPIRIISVGPNREETIVKEG